MSQVMTEDVFQKRMNQRPPRKHSDLCLWGVYCSHAILTIRIGVYRCPFDGECFKRVEAERKKREMEKAKK